MITIESQNGKFRFKPKKSINLKSNEEVETFSLRAQTSPTQEEISVSKKVGFKENVIGKEISFNGSTFFLTAIRPNNKKPLVFQEKGRYWSYLYLHPNGAKIHLPELAKLM
jgi:hypothetical protein